jgi:hypothetical protein
MKKIFLFICIACFTLGASAQKIKPFKVLALYENGGHHVEYSKRAKVWLNQLAAKNGFTIDYIQNTDKIDEAFLSLSIVHPAWIMRLMHGRIKPLKRLKNI